MRVDIVLVNTSYEINIGYVSRVMSNMGCGRLILINPQCEITYSAQQAAATGQNGLRNRVVYSSWPEFFSKEPEGIRIALTARTGRLRSVSELSETVQTLAGQGRFSKSADLQNTSIHLVFGAEQAGLSNHDIDQCHFACSLPTYGENTSYNLSHAVLAACLLINTTLKHTTNQHPKASFNVLQVDSKAKPFPEETLIAWLESLGLTVENRGFGVFQVLRRLFMHAIPTEEEFKALEVTLHQSIRKMREYQWYLKTYGLPNMQVSSKGSSKEKGPL